jgi:WhiB family redox-sensing transcriptional regulator
MNHSSPMLNNRASCQDYDPELWFPQETSGTRAWTRTPATQMARSICSTCPAKQECHDYAIQYSGLFGIWAGQDWYERDAEQKQLNLLPISFIYSYDTGAFRLKPDWSDNG